MSHTGCTICNKPIVLSPSASERALKYGGTAAYYKSLFTTHSQCFIEKRDTDLRTFMRSRSK